MNIKENSKKEIQNLDNDTDLIIKYDLITFFSPPQITSSMTRMFVCSNLGTCYCTIM